MTPTVTSTVSIDAGDKKPTPTPKKTHKPTKTPKVKKTKKPSPRSNQETAKTGQTESVLPLNNKSCLHFVDHVARLEQKKSGQATRRHPEFPPYCCFLSDLTGFAGFCRAGPTRTCVGYLRKEGLSIAQSGWQRPQHSRKHVPQHRSAGCRHAGRYSPRSGIEPAMA